MIENNHNDALWIRWICSRVVEGMKQNDLLALKKPLMDFIFDMITEDGIGAARAIIPILSSEDFDEIDRYFTSIFSGNLFWPSGCWYIKPVKLMGVCRG